MFIVEIPVAVLVINMQVLATDHKYWKQYEIILASMWENVPSEMKQNVRPAKTQISLRIRTVW